MLDASSPQHASPGCALDARFPTYTPGSRRYYDFLDAGEEQLLTAEIRRTVPPLVGNADNRVAKGQLTAAQADALAATWRAIAHDLEAQGVTHCTVAARLAELRAASGIAWTDKVIALRREIEARRSRQEAMVAKGQLTRDQAQQQLERLEAVHDLYWRQGFAFDGTRDELRAMTGPILDYDVEQQGAAPVAPAREVAA